MRAKLFVAPLFITLGLLAASPGATAQTLTCEKGDTFPCGLQIEAGNLQKVPAVFKFQARVSQAKLPIGQGVFSEVIVKLLAGDTPRCEERFQNVEVRDSVLNLEIGRNMSCELDEELATQTGLAFQVCLGSSSSCLKPIELASVPYAVKASYAYLAQSAQTADQAAVADYAYRVAADPDLQVLDAMSSGYFDFRTRADNDGYLQWTPLLNSASPILTITAQAYATQSALQLEKLVLDALTSQVNGALVVAGAASVTGDIVGSANLELVGDATIMGSGNIEQTLTIGDPRESGDTATLVVKRGGAEVQGGGLVVGGGGAAVTGDSTITGTVTVSGIGTFQSDVSVGGDLHASGGMVFPSTQGGAQVYAGAALVAVDPGAGGGELLVLGPRGWAGYDDLPAIHVDAPLVINNDVTTDSAHTATFNGAAGFNADASFNANVSFNGGEVDFRNATALPGLREFLGLSPSGDATLGNWSFQGDFINHAGASLIQGKADSNELEVLSDLRVDGTAILGGGLSVLGGDQGREAFFDVVTSFKRGVGLEGPLRMVTGGSSPRTTDLFVPFANGSVHVDDTRQLTELVFEAPTRFQRTMSVDADAHFTGYIYNGSWRLKDGSGFQHTVGGGGYARFLSFTGGGTQIVLDADRAFPGGTRVAGLLTVDQGIATSGGMSVGGGLSANDGLVVKANGATRLTTDSSQTRILQRAQVDGQLDVRGGSGSTMLGVSSSSVSISRSGVVTQVQGPLQVNSTVTATNGIRGTGVISTRQGACGWFHGNTCPDQLWMVGIRNIAFYTTPDVRCCVIELAP